MPTEVTVENFVRAESDRMFASFAAMAGGVNRLHHIRVPTPVEQQTVIRMNRDTLYSTAVVDLAEGAAVTIPDAGDRYVSVMVVNQDHYINRVFHEPGEHQLTLDAFGTQWVAVAARVLVDAASADDVQAVNDLQDGFAITAGSATPFEMPEYDTASLDATRKALLELARGLKGFDGAFGSAEQVDPIRHLIGTAAGWGGLPPAEARYLNVEPHLPVGAYELTVRDVPVDGFWSVSLYNAEGYFEPNPQGAYSVNNLTGARDADGAITIRFGGDPGAPNALPIVDGWNYVVRLYRPRPEILDGSWTFPEIAAG